MLFSHTCMKVALYSNKEILAISKCQSLKIRAVGKHEFTKKREEVKKFKAC